MYYTVAIDEMSKLLEGRGAHKGDVDPAGPCGV